MRKKLIKFICFIVLLVGLSSCKSIEDENENLPSESEEIMENNYKISVSDGTNEIIFLLNDSSASKSLYEQLPMQIEVENYGGNEKIFYPEPLDLSNTPLLQRRPAGTLAYFAPWGDVVMYYSQCSPYNGLYYLGMTIEGVDNISKLSGILHIEKVVEE